MAELPPFNKNIVQNDFAHIVCAYFARVLNGWNSNEVFNNQTLVDGFVYLYIIARIN